MQTGSTVIIIIFKIILCFIANDSIPRKFAKSEENFGGLIDINMVRFDFDKPPLHTIVYGGTGTVKTHFFRFLELLVQLL